MIIALDNYESIWPRFVNGMLIMNTTKKIDGRKNPNRKPWTPNLNFSMVDFHERQRRIQEEIDRAIAESKWDKNFL